MEVYFPSTYVKQTDLEVAYGASAGKFTIGLGQVRINHVVNIIHFPCTVHYE